MSTCKAFWGAFLVGGLSFCIIVSPAPAQQLSSDQPIVPDTLIRDWAREEVLGTPLFRPIHLVATEWGEIWVTDTGENRIYRWTTAGEPLEPVGREGAGPGEFRRPSHIRAWGGDSVSVWDRDLQRLTFFDRTGQVTSTRNLGLTIGVHGFLVNLDARGDTALVFTYNYPTRAIRPLEDRAVLWRFPGLGVRADSILTLPAPEMVIERGGETATRFLAPFSPLPFALFLPDGKTLIGHAGGSRFTVLDVQFEVLEEFTLELPVLDVLPSEVATFRDSTLAALSAGLNRAGMPNLEQSQAHRTHRRMLNDLDYPDAHPQYVKALVDEGILWLQLPSRAGDGFLTLRGFSLATKRQVEEVLIPIEGAVYNLARSGDAFVVTMVDELNRPQVVKYRK